MIDNIYMFYIHLRIFQYRNFQLEKGEIFRLGVIDRRYFIGSNKAFSEIISAENCWLSTYKKTPQIGIRKIPVAFIAAIILISFFSITSHTHPLPKRAVVIQSCGAAAPLYRLYAGIHHPKCSQEPRESHNRPLYWQCHCRILWHS
jgi:hypothetical protein